MEGGYIIFNLNGFDVDGMGTRLEPEQIAILEGSTEKAILLTGVLGFDTPTFIAPVKVNGTYTFEAYGYKFTLDMNILEARVIEGVEPATSSKYGTVKKAGPMNDLATDETTTLEVVIASFNTLLANLRNAEIMNTIN